MCIPRFFRPREEPRDLMREVYRIARYGAFAIYYRALVDPINGEYDYEVETVRLDAEGAPDNKQFREQLYSSLDVLRYTQNMTWAELISEAPRENVHPEDTDLGL